MIRLTKRQKAVLEYITKQGPVSNRETLEYLKTAFGKVSRVSIVRDIHALLQDGLTKREGKGRSVLYKVAEKNEVLRYIDVAKYFSKPADQRDSKERFDFEIFEKLKNILSKEELSYFASAAQEYAARVKSLSPVALRKEFERLTIEFSWKSSHLEGNTYSLIDTEVLIKENKEAKGHSREEAVMILNHKKALDYVHDRKSNFRKLDLRKIENVQSIIVEGLGVQKGMREKPVGIVGTRYKPLDNKHQIREAMEKACRVINTTRNPAAAALLAIAMISYIQPFEDGNKRTARLIGNAILLAHNYPPLSFRSVDEAEYKKALILFYEQSNLGYFKELFTGQYKFSIENYFL